MSVLAIKLGILKTMKASNIPETFLHSVYDKAQMEWSNGSDKFSSSGLTAIIDMVTAWQLSPLSTEDDSPTLDDFTDANAMDSTCGIRFDLLKPRLAELSGSVASKAQLMQDRLLKHVSNPCCLLARRATRWSCYS